MFFVTPQGKVLKGTKTVSKKCEHCGNTTDHFVWKQPHGPQIGFIFNPNMLGMKKYYLVCPTCNAAERELTKEQAYAMKEK